MASETAADGLSDASLVAVTRAELARWGVAETVEGVHLLLLAAALDDRAGIQGGGLASTSKEFRTLRGELAEKHAPKGIGRLELLRGGASAG